MKREKNNNQVKLQDDTVTTITADDYISNPIFADLKVMINEAIMDAMEHCGQLDTNTVSVSFDMERDLTTEAKINANRLKDDKPIKAFKPVTASIKVVSKKKLIDEKVETDLFTAETDQQGVTNIDKLQQTLFDQDKSKN